MIESVIYLLIQVCILALVVYLIIWVLGIVGVPLPPKVIQILWVIVGLVVILLLVHLMIPWRGRLVL